MSGLVDTHAHLMDPTFEPDRDSVVERARQAGLTALILVGYDLASSRAAVELARQIRGAFATVGIHPNSAADAADGDFDEIKRLACESEVVGIGETGLDNYRHHTPAERQREAFEWHLGLADDLGLPVIVHNREADEDVLRLTSGHRSGVLHCFSSGNVDYLDRMLAAGYFVSFAGTLTFKNAATLRSMAARVPHNHLLVETDSPYLAPEPHRGRRNEPAFVRETASQLLRLTGVTLDTLWANSVRAFPALQTVTEAVA